MVFHLALSEEISMKGAFLGGYFLAAMFVADLRPGGKWFGGVAGGRGEIAPEVRPEEGCDICDNPPNTCGEECKDVAPC